MEKGVMLSIHQNWIEMIFKEEKVLEFRNKIISTIKPETKLFIYETKKDRGIGKVVGEAIIKQVEKIDALKKESYLHCFKSIGYSNQKYVFSLIAIQKYDEPLDLSEFVYESDLNKVVKHPPQNMVNVRRKYNG